MATSGAPAPPLSSEFLGLAEAVRPHRLALAWVFAAGVVAVWGPTTLAGRRNRGAGPSRVIVVLLLLGVGLVAACSWVGALAAQDGRGVDGPAASDRADLRLGVPIWIGELESRIPVWMARTGVPGLNAMVIERGRVVWSASFGVADQESGRPMTPDAVFRVESISKPVTAWGVLRLVDMGRLALDDPVAPLLTGWHPPPDTPTFTVGQLLSHTGGIGLGDFTDRHSPDGHVPDLRTSLAREFRLDALPGTRFAYSDTGFNLLELVVEEVTGEDFGLWMAREILGPLGMAGASFDWDSTFAHRVPTAYTLRGEPVVPYVYPGRGSGGLFATLNDVARFVQAGMTEPNSSDPPVLSGRAIALLHTPVVDVGGLYGLVAEEYALGHFTEALSDGRASVWHGGQGYGWMTHAQWLPSTGDGIVLLANSQRAWPLFGRVLGTWSRSLGVAPVGMSRVTLAGPMAWVLIALLALGATVQALRLGLGVAAGRRRWVGRGNRSLTRSRRAVCIVQASLGMAAAGLVVWAASQDYLFLFSILPGVVGWLGGALLFAGAVSLASALLPESEPGEEVR